MGNHEYINTTKCIHMVMRTKVYNFKKELYRHRFTVSQNLLYELQCIGILNHSNCREMISLLRCVFIYRCMTQDIVGLSEDIKNASLLSVKANY